ncbi:MAG: hypothetical protein ACLFVT_01325 [Syntrophobacteria bacterium]
MPQEGSRKAHVSQIEITASEAAGLNMELCEGGTPYRMVQRG